MSRQANGTYIQPANTAAVSGQTISSTAFNSLITDVGTEITNSVDRLGRSAMQAALPMGNNKITGLATPTASTDAATKAYVDTVPLVDKSVTLQKLYHPTSTSKILGSDAAAALSITAAVNNGSGLIRLTIASTTASFATGQKKTVSDVVGTTEANGTWTITVVDGTHIDLQGSTFTNVYASGGTIGGAIAELSLGAGLSISGQSLIANPAGAWNYLSGLTMSTPGSSATMSIAAGVANDSTNSTFMTLAATSKTTASWVVGAGNGGIDTGSIANSTWYHFYVIQRVDTGVVDVVFSLSASAPALPTNYTLYRRIGSGKTDGSGKWVAFVQFGDDFLWLAPPGDVATTTLTGTPTSFTLASVPTGVKVFAHLTGFFQNALNGTSLLIQSPDATGAGPNGTTGLGTARLSVANIGVTFVTDIRTNTSAQIVAYADQANSTLNVATKGWTDLRGKV